MSLNGHYKGNIVGIRAIEDTIRATKKYTEGIGTMRQKHPIQGEEFASKVFCKYYEVYPDMEVSWDMPAEKAIDWLWGGANKPGLVMIDVKFRYDYRANQAELIVEDGASAIKRLANAIPNFSDALARVIANGGAG